jgi:tetratricopeptide (TPR) repeat protein
VNRGVVRIRGGDVGGAIFDYTQALRIDPGDPETYFNRGNAYVLVQDYTNAVQDYTYAIQLSPMFTRAIFNRGTAYRRAGNRAAAAADWRTAIDLESDPWTKAGMERSVSVESTAGMPLATATTPPAGSSGSPQPPSFVAAPPPANVVPAPADTPPPAQDLDARALVSRAVSRELDGDRFGAIVDLRAAIAKESDPTRRAKLQNLLQLLQTQR